MGPNSTGDDSSIVAWFASQLDGIEPVAFSGGNLEYVIPLTHQSCMVTLLRHFEQAKHSIGARSLILVQTSLEDVFLRVGHDLEECSSVSYISSNCSSTSST